MTLAISFTAIFLGWLITSALTIFMWLIQRQRMDRQAQSATYATWGGSISKTDEVFSHPALIGTTLADQTASKVDTDADGGNEDAAAPGVEDTDAILEILTASPEVTADHKTLHFEFSDIPAVDFFETIDVGETNDVAELYPVTTGTALADDESAPLVRSLDDMLDGIELPYDLTPVSCLVENPERHLVFLTTHSNAEEVGTRFADEVVRLGYEFQPVGLDKAIAVRGEDVISMAVIPEAGDVTDEDRRRYWAAGAGDVALELWVGRSASPPATVNAPAVTGR